MLQFPLYPLTISSFLLAGPISSFPLLPPSPASLSFICLPPHFQLYLQFVLYHWGLKVVYIFSSNFPLQQLCEVGLVERGCLTHGHPANL